MLLQIFILQNPWAFYPLRSTWKTCLCPVGAEVQNSWRVFCFDIPQWQWALQEEGTPYAPPFPLPIPAPPPIPSSLPVLLSFFKTDHKHVLGAHVPFFISVRHSWPPFPAVPMWGKLSISSRDKFLKGRFEPFWPFKVFLWHFSCCLKKMCYFYF